MPRRPLLWSARDAFRLKVDRNSIIACAETKSEETRGESPGGDGRRRESNWRLWGKKERGEQRRAEQFETMSEKLQDALITRPLIGPNLEGGRNRLCGQVTPNNPRDRADKEKKRSSSPRSLAAHSFAPHEIPTVTCVSTSGELEAGGFSGSPKCRLKYAIHSPRLPPHQLLILTM